MPNRYNTHTKKLNNVNFKENTKNLKIHRIKLPSHKSGMIDQAISFIAFFVGVFRLTRNSKYDVIFATSSRLMTAF